LLSKWPFRLISANWICNNAQLMKGRNASFKSILNVTENILPMKFSLIVATTLISCINMLGQMSECGTVASPEQITHMNNYSSFMFQSIASHKQITSVPVVPHIIRRSDGTGGITATDVLKEIDSVNFFYANAGIQFFVCGNIEFIDDDQYYTFYSYDENSLGNSYDVPNVINIYFADRVYSGSSAVCGYSHFPPGADRIMMSDMCATNGSTLAHEIGHYFSLFHTHGNGGGLTSELVNGSNCSATGDEICDTPADPTLQDFFNVDAQCNYTGGLSDALGAAYVPQTNNIMSYSRKQCRNLFTTQQYQRIAYSLTVDRTNLICSATGIASDFNAGVTVKQYPNPFDGILSVEYTLTKNSEVKIELTNMLGEKVMSITDEQVSGKYRKDLFTNQLAEGVYLLSTSIDGLHSVQKVVCNH